MNIDKITISNKVLFGKIGFQYFIGYKNHDKIEPFCIMLAKMNGFAKSFNETKYMWFLIEYENMLKACNNVRDEINNIMQKGFDSQPAYDEKNLKTKTILWRISKYKFIR